MGAPDPKTFVNKDLLSGRSGAGGDAFPRTRWSVVAKASGGEGDEQQRAWAELFETYWFPLYAYARRRGRSPQDAEDVAQRLFARLFEKDALSRADQEKGRLRSFLLGALKKEIINDVRKEVAQKRGGGAVKISLDAERAEERYANEPVEAATPESEFEKRWALQILEATMADLEAEFAARGKAEQFEAFKPHLSGDAQTGAHAEIAAALGMKEGAVRIAVFRARQRFGQLLRERITDTVASEDEVELEINYFLSVFES